MVEVEVTNFQSIEHAKINIDGFTALVGKSNIGKSAIVRAIKAALTGGTGTSFVRHGATCTRRVKTAKTCECYCSVHIVTEGFDLKWEKGDKRNRYVFNGTEYGVPNRGTPDFLERPMLPQDFGMVRVGEQWKLLQIADQFDAVFLLDQSGSVVADVFSDVARLDCINVAMRLVEKDRKEAVSTRKVREKDIGELATRLVEYENLDDAVAKVKVVEQKLERISVIQDKVDTLGSYIEDIRSIGFRVDGLQKACKIEVPSIDPVVAKHGHFEKVTLFQVAVSERATIIRSLLGVETLKEPVIAPIVEAAQKFRQVSTWSAKLQGFQESFGRFRGFGDIPTHDTTTIKAAQDKFAQLSALTQKQDSLIKTVRGLEQGYSEALSEETALDAEKKEFGYCPTCEQEIGNGHKHAQKVA